jgi:hypothetical protein
MIDIKKKDGSVESMNVDEFTRWMCLVEAIFFIKQKAKDLNLNFEDLIKPLPIDDYIKDRFPSMKHDVECEHLLGNI